MGLRADAGRGARACVARCQAARLRRAALEAVARDGHEEPDHQQARHSGDGGAAAPTATVARKQHARGRRGNPEGARRPLAAGPAVISGVGGVPVGHVPVRRAVRTPSLPEHDE